MRTRSFLIYIILQERDKRMSDRMWMLEEAYAILPSRLPLSGYHYFNEEGTESSKDQVRTLLMRISLIVLWGSCKMERTPQVVV